MFSFVMLFECQYSYSPPLKYTNEKWNHLILVTNERSKRKVRSWMTKGSTFSWQSVHGMLRGPILRALVATAVKKKKKCSLFLFYVFLCVITVQVDIEKKNQKRKNSNPHIKKKLTN